LKSTDPVRNKFVVIVKKGIHVIVAAFQLERSEKIHNNENYAVLFVGRGGGANSVGSHERRKRDSVRLSQDIRACLCLEWKILWK
jgi:hypothetical protein